MTDEELAKLILETRDDEPDPLWRPLDDQEGAWRDLPRVREVWTRIARRVRDRLEANKREQTAATILAALIRQQDERAPTFGIGPLSNDEREACVYAVALADALRAELAKVKP